MGPAKDLPNIWPPEGLIGFEMDTPFKVFIVGCCKLIAVSFTVAGGLRGGTLCYVTFAVLFVLFWVLHHNFDNWTSEILQIYWEYIRVFFLSFSLLYLPMFTRFVGIYRIYLPTHVCRSRIRSIAVLRPTGNDSVAGCYFVHGCGSECCYYTNGTRFDTYLGIFTR